MSESTLNPDYSRGVGVTFSSANGRRVSPGKIAFLHFIGDVNRNFQGEPGVTLAFVWLNPIYARRRESFRLNNPPATLRRSKAVFRVGFFRPLE